MRLSDYCDYLDCRKQKVKCMSSAREVRHDPVLRKLIVQTALMYRKHAMQWKVLANF